jgi:hypothetical protein
MGANMNAETTILLIVFSVLCFCALWVAFYKTNDHERRLNRMASHAYDSNESLRKAMRDDHQMARTRTQREMEALGRRVTDVKASVAGCQNDVESIKKRLSGSRYERATEQGRCALCGSDNLSVVSNSVPGHYRAYCRSCGGEALFTWDVPKGEA